MLSATLISPGEYLLLSKGILQGRILLGSIIFIMVRNIQQNFPMTELTETSSTTDAETTPVLNLFEVYIVIHQIYRSEFFFRIPKIHLRFFVTFKY